MSKEHITEGLKEYMVYNDAFYTKSSIFSVRSYRGHLAF